MRRPVGPWTLARANDSRDLRISAGRARRLIGRACGLYTGESFGVGLTIPVYALDSTTIDLCLSMFPFGQFHSTKAAIKLYTLLDLRASIPRNVHIFDSKLSDADISGLLPAESNAISL